MQANPKPQIRGRGRGSSRETCLQKAESPARGEEILTAGLKSPTPSSQDQFEDASGNSLKMVGEPTANRSASGTTVSGRGRGRCRQACLPTTECPGRGKTTLTEAPTSSSQDQFEDAPGNSLKMPRDLAKNRTAVSVTNEARAETNKSVEVAPTVDTVNSQTLAPEGPPKRVTAGRGRGRGKALAEKSIHTLGSNSAKVSTSATGSPSAIVATFAKSTTRLSSSAIATTFAKSATGSTSAIASTFTTSASGSLSTIATTFTKSATGTTSTVASTFATSATGSTSAITSTFAKSATGSTVGRGSSSAINSTPVTDFSSASNRKVAAGSSVPGLASPPVFNSTFASDYSSAVNSSHLVSPTHFPTTPSVSSFPPLAQTRKRNSALSPSRTSETRNVSVSYSHQKNDRPSQHQPKRLEEVFSNVKNWRGGVESQYRIPTRKSQNGVVGQLGHKIFVETNHLRLYMDKPSNIVYHYDVVISPEKPYRLYRQILETFRAKNLSTEYPAFDGKKNLYFANRLPSSELSDTVKVWDDESNKQKEFRIKIKLVNCVDMSTIWSYLEKGTSTDLPQEAIQALDIVLRTPAAHNFVQVGRSYFTAPPGIGIHLSDGLDLWYGFFQSAILGWTPYLNIDVAHKGFPSPVNVVDAIRRILSSRERRNGCSLKDVNKRVDITIERGDLDVPSKSALRSFLKGLKVVYQLPSQPNSNRAYLINDIADSAIRTKFKLESGKEVSVRDFFKIDKNYELRYPGLPCLHVGPIKRNICLPAELCTIMGGQAMTRKLNENQTRQMVTSAARPADERRKKIMDSMNLVDMVNDKCISNFGIRVSTSFEKVPARVLQPPVLGYSSSVRPRDGVWRPEKFVSSISLINWTIINIDDRTTRVQLEYMTNELQCLGPQLGVDVKRPEIITGLDVKRGINAVKTVLAPLFNEQKEKGKQIVVVVMISTGEQYAKIKQIAELETGLLTQCIKGKTVQKCSVTTVTNILLKINAKLNGINHRIPEQTWPVYFSKVIIVIGADVTHPSPEQHDIPSCAAVVASHDLHAFQYNMIWRLQPPRVEIIEDLEEIIKEQLMTFKRATKLKPEGILFYRDGVSEGQFRTVLDKEMSAIRRACVSLNPDYKPTITFLVVQKRHHTRFFPKPEDADGKNKNVPAGTIVDTNITHPTELDFFLVSHASIQGTSRPTKYHLLWDDAGMSEDDLEQMTFYLCHMFTRCTRSVSYPAPTYYAHLAAFRIRAYFENNRITNEKLSSTMRRMKIDEVLVKQNPMFFV